MDLITSGRNLIAKLRAMSGRGVGVSWFDSSITRADEAFSKYSTRDQRIWELVPRLTGMIDSLVNTNASACTSVPLRLYRVMDESTAKERRRYPGKKSTPATRARIRAIKAGEMGVKSAMLANIGGEVEEVTDHPILDFIHRPNPIFPGMTLAQMRFRCKWGFGEYYERIENGEDGKPLRAWPLFPQFTRIQFSKDGYIEAFNYGRDQTNPIPYSPDEVVFYKHRPALSNPLRGESPLGANLPQADILYKNMMHDIAFVNGGNRPDSLITVKDPNATPDQIREVESRVQALASGGIASVKAFVTRDIEWKPLSWMPKDLNTPEKLDRYERHLRTAYGHTESMADSTDTNVASAVIGFNAQFMGNTIHPALINDAAEMTEFLIPRFGYGHGEYFLCYDNPVTADSEKESRVAIAEMNAGRITINEARERAGLPPSTMPEADDLRINGVKLGVMDTAGQVDSSNPLAALFSGGRASTDNSSEADDQPVDRNTEEPEVDEETPEQGKGARSLSPEAKEWALSVLRGRVSDLRLADDESVPCGCCKAGSITGNTALDAVVADNYPSLLRSIEAPLRAIQGDILSAIARGGVPDLAEQTGILADALYTHLEPLVQEMAKVTVSDLAEMGLDTPAADTFVPTEAIRSYKEHVSLVADDIAQYTEELIKPAVERGMELGLSTQEVAAEIENADIPGWRAERIARTEVSEATNGARMATMEEVGVEQVKIVTAPSPSEAHAIIAARSPKPIGSNFVEAGETIAGETFKEAKQRPPFRPHCRCRIEPVL